MSVSGISSSSFANYGSQSIQNRMQTARQEFQQLGQDLQSGNLTAAQSDFATLQQFGPQSGSSTQSSNPVAQGLQPARHRSQGGQHHGGTAGLRQDPAGLPESAGRPDPDPSPPSSSRRWRHRRIQLD